MRRRGVLGALAVAVTLTVALGSPGDRLAARATDNTNVVVAWNRIMLTTLAAAVVPPPAATRLGATVQAAVFDAVNGVRPRYTSIRVAPAAPPGASPRAAAAAAAYTALVSLLPSQKAALDADFAATIAALNGSTGAARSPPRSWPGGRLMASAPPRRRTIREPHPVTGSRRRAGRDLLRSGSSPPRPHSL